jgi:hypothetical protein
VISYGAAAFTFSAGIPGRTLTPQAGSPVTGWSIAPQLPPGLTFNTTDGSISGTPTAASSSTPYTATAQGSAGTLSVTFAIEVDTDVLFDLGHNAAISSLQFNGSSVLSADANGHWVLWDYATGTMIASGDAPNVNALFVSPGDNLPPVLPSNVTALAGATAVIQTPTGLQVLSATTGVLSANISASFNWWTIATDGSYIVAGSQTGLSVWSPSGQLLISRPGNYASAIAFASPGTLRVAQGAAGTNVVEAVSVPNGAAVVSPQFKGQFTSWFVDGSGFLSTVIGSGTTPTMLYAYSSSAAQEAAVTNPGGNYYGQGQWLWTLAPGNTTLTVSTLAAPTTPVATYSFGDAKTMVSGSTIGVSDFSSGRFSVIDLSGSAPAKTDYSPPFGAFFARQYAAASASQWIAGNGVGVLLDGASLGGTPRFLDYGEALSLAGNASRIVLATASGRIVYFNATTLAQEGTIAFPNPAQTPFGSAFAQAALSSDGSILAFLGPDDTSVNIYSLPSATLLYTWRFPLSGGWLPWNISLSASGTVLGITTTLPDTTFNGVLSVPSLSFMDTAAAATGGAPIVSSQFKSSIGSGSPVPMLLSPDGSQIATTIAGEYPDLLASASRIGTNIVKSGVMVPFVPGWPVGWIDNTHLLVNTYVQNTAGGPPSVYAGCTIYDLSATATGTCALPELLGFQTVDSDTLFTLNQPRLVSLSTGAVIWQSGDALPCAPSQVQFLPLCFPDALAGNHVVLVSDSRVVVQSY